MRDVMISQIKLYFMATHAQFSIITNHYRLNRAQPTLRYPLKHFEYKILMRAPIRSFMNNRKPSVH